MLYRVVALLAMLACGTGVRAQSPPAQVGPLQAWVSRSESGVCQLRLRNVGTTAVVAWTVTVRSEDARYVTVFRHDGWRDEFHLPAAALRVPGGEIRTFTVDETGALGTLTVRIHLVVLADGVAHGMPVPASHVGAAPEELARLVERRRMTAAEARAVADTVDVAIGEQGMATVLTTRLTSTRLENEGSWNWWRVAEAAKAAEAKGASNPRAAADLRVALDLLREAHRRGTAPVVLSRAEPMHPVAVASCTAD